MCLVKFNHQGLKSTHNYGVYPTLYALFFPLIIVIDAFNGLIPSFSCLAHQFKNSSQTWFCSVLTVFLIKENDGNCLAIARDQNLGSLFILLDQAHMNEWNRNWLSLKILPCLWTCQPIDQGLYIWTHYSF